MCDKPMIVSVSTQLPPPALTANEIMQRVQEMLNPLIELDYKSRGKRIDGVLDSFVQLKRDVWGSSDA
jgi:hypothetical protein